MKRFSFRLNLLLALLASGILISCDDGTQTSQTSINVQDSTSVNLSNLIPREPSWAGSYLAARVAQERFDWVRSETFLTQTDHLKPDNNILTRRLMLLAMGSGDFQTALAQAKKIANDEDQSGLTRLILILEPLRDGQMITAQTMLPDLQKTVLGNYAEPMIRAWIMAAKGETDLSALSHEKSYFFHQVLLADFLNQIDLVANPARIAAAQNQLNPISSERIADILLRRQKFDLAAALYRLTASLNPNTPHLQERQDAANRRLTNLSSLQLPPPISDARAGMAMIFFDMATSFYNDRSNESAQLFAQMALTLDPNLIEAQLLIGNLLSRNNRAEAAISIYQKIPENSKNYADTQQQIAALYVSQNQSTEAISTLQSLLTKTNEKDKKIDILLQIGDIHRDNQNFDAALTAYDTAMEILDHKPSAKDWTLLYARGMTLERLKRWREAEADLKAALAFQPDHPYLLNYLGYSWADQNINLDQAMALLLRAVKIVPNDGYITDSVGWIYYRMNQFDLAVKYLEQAVELLPYDPTVNDHLGDAYARVHRPREAKFQWQRALNFSKDEVEKQKIQNKIENGIDFQKP